MCGDGADEVPPHLFYFTTNYRRLRSKWQEKHRSGRNAAGAGNIRKKKVTRAGKEYYYWEARLTVGFDPGTGKQVQKSFTGKTQKEVREKMQAAAVAVNTGDYFEPTKMTLSKWIEVWLQEYGGDKKYSTLKHYKAQCKAHISPSLGALRLSELTAPQIQVFYNQLQRDGLAPKSIRNIHGILRKCLSTAVRVGYLRTNPSGRCDTAQGRAEGNSSSYRCPSTGILEGSRW